MGGLNVAQGILHENTDLSARADQSTERVEQNRRESNKGLRAKLSREGDLDGPQGRLDSQKSTEGILKAKANDSSKIFRDHAQENKEPDHKPDNHTRVPDRDMVSDNVIIVDGAQDQLDSPFKSMLNIKRGDRLPTTESAELRQYVKNIKSEQRRKPRRAELAASLAKHQLGSGKSRSKLGASNS